MLKSQAKEMEREEGDMSKPEDRGEPILSQQQKGGSPVSAAELLQWNAQKQLQEGGAYAVSGAKYQALLWGSQSRGAAGSWSPARYDQGSCLFPFST